MKLPGEQGYGMPQCNQRSDNNVVNCSKTTQILWYLRVLQNVSWLLDLMTKLWLVILAPINTYPT